MPTIREYLKTLNLQGNSTLKKHVWKSYETLVKRMTGDKVDYGDFEIKYANLLEEVRGNGDKGSEEVEVIVRTTSEFKQNNELRAHLAAMMEKGLGAETMVAGETVEECHERLERELVEGVWQHDIELEFLAMVGIVVTPIFLMDMQKVLDANVRLTEDVQGETTAPQHFIGGLLVNYYMIGLDKDTKDQMKEDFDIFLEDIRDINNLMDGGEEI